MRINKKNKKKIIIAVILGVIATLVLFNSNKSKEAELQKLIQDQNNAINTMKQSAATELSQAKKKGTAVIAAKDINIGDTYLADMLEVKEFPEEELPEGYFKNAESVVGKKAGKNLVKGQFITSLEIQSDDISSIDIPVNMRAVSIPVDKIKGLASYFRIGTNVDILKATTPPEYLVQNVKIAGFESASGSNTSRYNATDAAAAAAAPQQTNALQANAITFLFPINLVPTILSSIEEGQIMLIARNNTDDKVVLTEKDLPPPPLEEVKTEKMPELTVPEEPAKEANIEPPKLPAPEPKKIELIKASAVSTIEFDDNGDDSSSNSSSTAKKEDDPTAGTQKKLKELLDLVK